MRKLGNFNGNLDFPTIIYTYIIICICVSIFLIFMGNWEKQHQREFGKLFYLNGTSTYSCWDLGRAFRAAR